MVVEIKCCSSSFWHVRGVCLFFQQLSKDSGVDVDVNIVDVTYLEVFCTPSYLYFISIEYRGIEYEYTVSYK